MINEINFIFPYVFFAYLQLILYNYSRERKYFTTAAGHPHTLLSLGSLFVACFPRHDVSFITIISYPHKFMLDKQTQPLNKLV